MSGWASAGDAQRRQLVTDGGEKRRLVAGAAERLAMGAKKGGWRRARGGSKLAPKTWLARRLTRARSMTCCGLGHARASRTENG
jgi:hypothetical protein